MNYIKESFKELSKVSWPTLNQTVKLTAFVVGFTVASAMLIGALDYVLNTAYQATVDFSVEQGLNSNSGQALPVDVTQSGPAAGQIELGDISVDADGELQTEGITIEVGDGAEEATEPTN